MLTSLSIYAVLSYIGNVYSVEDFISPSALMAIKKPFIMTSAIKPESVERFQFLMSVILIPCFLYLFQFILIKFFRKYNLNLKNVFCLNSIIFYMTAILCLYIILYLPFQNYFVVNIQEQLYVYLFCIAFIILFFSAKNKLLDKIICRVIDIASIILIIIISSCTVFSIKNVTFNEIFSLSFQAVFLPVVQVFLGKGLLINCISQYGLYPHFLIPVYKFVGLSVFSFTLTMSILIGVTFILIFLFLRLHLKNYSLIFLGLLSYLYYSYILIPADLDLHMCYDPYFQYYPIRTIFPAFFIFLVYLYIRNNNRFLYYLIFCISSISILWNLDTGIIIFIASIIVFSYMEFSSDNHVRIIKNIIKHIISGILSLAIILILYSSCIRICYNQWPELLRVFDFQNIFYISGFNMLPMKGYHPWLVLALIYISGLSFSIFVLINRKISIESSVIFMLSILGIGIFSYFQGRSHDFNLMHVSYPAILILTIFTDRILSYIIKSKKKFIFNAGTLLLFLCLLWIMSISLTGIYKDLSKHDVAENSLKPSNSEWEMTKLFRPGLHEQNESLLNNILFINKNTQPGDSILVLSYLSSIYYLNARSPNSSQSCDYVYFFLKTDRSKLIKYISSKKAEKIFFDNSKSDIYFYKDEERSLVKSIDLNYYIFDKNDQGMFCFKPK